MTDAALTAWYIEQLTGDANAVIDWQSFKTESRVDRSVDGISNRVDRLRGLGNSVVPQIPEIIGRSILEAEAA